VALVDALAHLKQAKSIDVPLLTSSVAAVSVGIVSGEIMIDLCYAEDSNAWVDMNIVMTGHGKIVEIQGTAEAEPFSIQDLQQMLSMAKSTIGIISAKQRDSLGEVLWNSLRGT
jgi:ribonuclease PH